MYPISARYSELSPSEESSSSTPHGSGDEGGSNGSGDSGGFGEYGGWVNIPDLVLVEVMMVMIELFNLLGEQRACNYTKSADAC